MTVRVRLRAMRRGPLVVEPLEEGAIELIGLNGEPIDCAGMRKFRLCRCGASSAAPLCDGSHNRVSIVGDQEGDLHEGPK